LGTSPGRMHAEEVHTDEGLVRRLLGAQFPRWSELPIERVPSAGTDNALYRLGDEMVVRLPRIHWAVANVETEQRWLPTLAARLPLAIPVPLAKGMPSDDYPWPWSVHRWLPGEDATTAVVANLRQAAIDLAAFLTALQAIDPMGGPVASDHGLRGVPLVTRDGPTREAIAALRGMIDTDAATAAWESAVQAPAWDRAPVWFHGDVLPGNLLFEGGRLTGVIDFGGLGVGDPACDLMIAWNLFSGQSRDAFRATLGVDDATWARGRGHALSQAVIFIPYYLDTNPVGVATARRALHEVLAEHRRGEGG
jgi:aminoglycoside phosphotransferase (APT) family kinase protein